jgi:hypothetical protein
MALPPALEKTTSQLPVALRQELEGYLRTLQEVEPEIYREAATTHKEVPRDEFLLVVVIWRLYSQVEGQRWVMQNSLDIASGFGAGGFRAGRLRFSGTSDDTAELQELHRSFDRWLRQQKLDFIRLADGPRDVLEGLRQARNAAG